MNVFHRMNGVSVATLYYLATVAKGIQIGLINRAREMRVSRLLMECEWP